MVLKFTDSQLEREYAYHHASLSFQTDFLFSALNGLVRAPLLIVQHLAEACLLPMTLMPSICRCGCLLVARTTMSLRARFGPS